MGCYSLVSKEKEKDYKKNGKTEKMKVREEEWKTKQICIFPTLNFQPRVS